MEKKKIGREDFEAHNTLSVEIKINIV